MPKLTHVTVTALKDATIVTGEKATKYLDDSVKPPQWKSYESKHGLSIREGQVFELDLTDPQVAMFQAAVSRGEVEVEGLPPAPATTRAKEK